MEKWEDVEGYEGIYQVSSKGRVRSINRESYGKQMKGRVLKQNGKDGGYRYIYLSKDGIVSAFNVHVLVAKAFVKGYKEGLEVHHKDEDKANNNASNLEWVTELENHLKAVRSGAHCKKLTRRDYHLICRRLSKGQPLRRIAKKFKVTDSAIAYIRRAYLHGWELHREFGTTTIPNKRG